MWNFANMKLSILRVLFLLHALSVFAFASNSVVNMSHYDLMRPDFVAMKSEGILGVIHEATYPRFDRDARYRERQVAATQVGLLWRAYHYGDATNPIRQADHFLGVVAASAPAPRLLKQSPSWNESANALASIPVCIAASIASGRCFTVRE
ncbi:MAG: hypothetical protein E6L07_03590 [Verrucomicrobia bacterium]|nr:MAG: hypothetical protein E6L07_03590 [Verrucomicrobiota bacterium]